MNGMTGLVSVLLTSYESPSFLSRAIDSVMQQTYDNWELIILDDNSKNPEVGEIYQNYWNHPKIIIYKSNVQDQDRFSCARYAVQINVGLKFCNGEYITYLCSDDWYLSHRLETMVKFLKQHPEANIVCGYQEKWQQDESDNLTYLGIRQYPEIISEAYAIVDHSSVLHRYSCTEKVGDWPTRNLRAADAEYWRKLNQAGYVFHVIPEVLDAHRFHSNSLSIVLNRI
jgi:spore maturation protein CgeD